MGRLRHDDAAGFTLAERTLVGRGETCHLRIDDPRVSGLHAMIYYQDGRWWLRDLGSRNGTYLEGAPIKHHQPLQKGSRVQFHASATSPWVLADDAPPGARATRLGPTEGNGANLVVEADAGLLFLPPGESPEAQIHHGPEGGWAGEWVSSGETFAVQDGEVLEVTGDPWRLALPPWGPGTHIPETQQDTPGTLRLGLSALALRVRVSRDRETGGVSYDPENHEVMTKLRAEKVERVQQEIPPTEVVGDAAGDGLAVGCGSTRGSIEAAVRAVLAQGVRAWHVHLRWLSPLPPALDDVAGRFERVLVPELNNGQLVHVLRDRFLRPVESLAKIQGLPFKTREIADRIREIANDA